MTTCPPSWTAPRWSRARSPTCTCSPTSSASTASAACASDDLIDAILARQAGDEPPSRRPRPSAEADDAEAEPTTPSRRAERRRRRGARERPRRGRRGGRGRGRTRRGEPTTRRARRRRRRPREAEDSVVEGVVELLANGSGFVRLSPPEPTDDDVYVSAAQVKRCELVSGDRVAGPVRPPRRSERFPSLVRVDTINGRPADEVAEGTRFEDLPVAFPAERLELGSEDPTVKAIEWLTPFGKGSRVVIAGPARAGKSEALRRLAARARRDARASRSASCSPACGPEEIAEWPGRRPARR